MRYVLDTHTLVWHLTNDMRLGEQARRILDNPDALLIVPALVLAEAKHIADRKRIAVAFDEILNAVLASSRTTVFPIDIFVLNYLSSDLNIHDGLIVATARFCQDLFQDQTAILTRDQAIAQSGLVPVLW